MKLIDLGRGLKGIELDPDNPRDKISSFTVARFRRSGASEESIRIYKNFRRRIYGPEDDEDDE